MNNDELMKMFGGVVSEARSESEVVGHFTGVMTGLKGAYCHGRLVHWKADDASVEADRVGLEFRDNEKVQTYYTKWMDAAEFNKLDLTYGDVVVIECDVTEYEDKKSTTTGLPYRRVVRALKAEPRKVGHVKLMANALDENGHAVMENGKAKMVESDRGERHYPQFKAPRIMSPAEAMAAAMGLKLN